MKKLMPLILLLAGATLAFGQGRIIFGNDSLHLVYFTTDTTRLLPGDVALAGQPVPGPGLSVDLFGGTSSSALSLLIVTTFNGTPGEFGPVNVSLPGIPGGVPDYFQVHVYSTSAGSYAAAAAGNLLYYGESPVFTCIPNAGLGYNSIVDPNYSTWPPGPPIPGGRGGIEVQMNPVPEPGVLALAGVALAVAAWRRTGLTTDNTDNTD